MTTYKTAAYEHPTTHQ